MRVWLITVGEPLPGLSPGARMWRTGLLAEQLLARGHEVIWWASNVDHFRKELFTTDGGTMSARPGLTLRLLTGALYKRNVSLARLFNHWQLGRQFRYQARVVAKPEVILCSFPTIELSDEAVGFAREHGVSAVLDVRDLWPDIFVAELPAVVRWMGRAALTHYYSATRRAMRGASAIIAVSSRYLEWGLLHAQRPAGVNDRVFPLGYSFPDVGLLDSETRRAILQRFEVAADAVTCVFAGTMGRTYDLRPVIDAARRLATHFAGKFQFLICGDGERARGWRQMAQDVPNLRFAGWLGQEDLRAALRVSDVGLAAYAEGAPQGVPNKIIEYLAAGLPVVSSLRGESEELLAGHGCGLTYRAGDEGSLVEILVALADANRRMEMATKARRTFEEHFRAEAVYAALASYLEETASRAPSHREDG